MQNVLLTLHLLSALAKVLRDWTIDGWPQNDGLTSNSTLPLALTAFMMLFHCTVQCCRVTVPPQTQSPVPWSNRTAVNRAGRGLVFTDSLAFGFVETQDILRCYFKECRKRESGRAMDTTSMVCFTC